MTQRNAELPPSSLKLNTHNHEAVSWGRFPLQTASSGLHLVAKRQRRHSEVLTSSSPPCGPQRTQGWQPGPAPSPALQAGDETGPEPGSQQAGRGRLWPRQPAEAINPCECPWDPDPSLTASPGSLLQGIGMKAEAGRGACRGVCLGLLPPY